MNLAWLSIALADLFIEPEKRPAVQVMCHNPGCPKRCGTGLHCHEVHTECLPLVMLSCYIPGCYAYHWHALRDEVWEVVQIASDLFKQIEGFERQLTDEVGPSLRP